MSYLFYRRKHTPDRHPVEPRPDLTVELWRPRLTQPLVPDLPWYPFGIWTLLHALRVFATRDYAVLLIRQGGRLVNRTCILPPHCKFPFMQPGELQVAGLWTDPARRGEGLGLLGVQEALRRLGGEERVFWYLVKEDNRPSILLAEKLGFQLWGRGERKPWLGLRAVGRFHLTEANGSFPLGAGQHADARSQAQSQQEP